MAFLKFERDESTIAKYSSNTLQGNWFEESYKKNEDLLEFVTKMRKGELMHQYAGQFYARHEADVVLSPDNPFIYFGDRIMIINPLLKSEQPRNIEKYTGLSVGIVFLVNDYIRSPEIFPGMHLGCSGEITPALRNSFCIESIDGKQVGDKLCYGENFTLSVLHSYANRKLYVESRPPHFSAPIGFSQKIRVSLVAHYSVYCRWKAVHVDPVKRYASFQTPVPSNSNIMIVHSSTNLPLCALDYRFPTVFGFECELTIERQVNQFKRPQYSNVWQLRNDAQPGSWEQYMDLVKNRDERKPKVEVQQNST